MKVKTGDTVKIIAGKDKGKEGTIVRVLREQGKAVVEGLNLYKRHIKNKGDKGQIVEFAAPVDASNLKVITSATKDTKKKPVKKAATKE